MNLKNILFALCLALTLQTLASQAATGPSWAQDDAWNANNPVSQPDAPRKSVQRMNARGRETSPFSPGSHNVSVDIGQIFLMGDLNAKYSDNLGWRLRYTYGVSDIFAFDAGVGYSEHSNGKFSLATGNVGLRTNLTWFDKVIPYITLGLGFYRPSYDQTVGGMTQNMAPFLFGIHVGPGVTLQLSRLFFFGTAVTFHNMFGINRNNEGGGPGDIGGAFTSFFLHAGISL